MITNEYGVAERQERLLDMMKDFDLFMTEHKIRYSLCGGTLLGAIRHQGFIPWDDDVDVIMDRSNFEKLVTTFQSLGNQVAIQRDGQTSPTEYVFSRTLWIYRIVVKGNEGDENVASVPTIDVFTMDDSPDSIFVRKMKTLAIQALQGMMRKRPVLSNYAPFYRICLIVTYVMGKFLSDAVKFKMYDAVSKIGTGKRASKLTAYNAIYQFLDLRYEPDILDSFERRPFEDALLPVMGGYDSYLTTQYGDYMTPPPPEERISKHI